MTAVPAIVAGGVSASDVTGAVTEKYIVTRTDDAKTTSQSYVPLPGMSITVNPGLACNAVIVFTGTCEQYNDLLGYVTMGIALYLDGAQVAETLLSPYATLEYIEGWPVPRLVRLNGSIITAVQNLSPGSHTFEMRFRGVSDFIATSGLKITERTLLVSLFYR